MRNNVLPRDREGLLKQNSKAQNLRQKVEITAEFKMSISH